MKKVLLVILAMALFAGLRAQDKKVVLKSPAKMAVRGVADSNNLPLFPLNPTNPVTMKGAVVTSPVGTSANIYNNITSVTNLTTYHWDVDVIGFVHRAGGAWGGNSGDIRWKFSNDYGTSWDSLEFIHPNASNNFRYPNISMVNPAGNTTMTNAFAVVNGPCTDGGGWVNNFFASQRLDKTLTDIQLQAIPADTQNLCLANSTWCDGGIVFNSQDHSTDPGGAQFFTVNKGVFDFGTSTMTWTQSPRISHHFKNRTFANTTSTWAFNNSFAASQDGNIVYFYCFGKDSLNNPLDLALPHVWKSTDGGATFSKINTSNMDDVPGLQQWIYPTFVSSISGGPLEYRPMFMCGSTAEESNFPAVVDANGDLHMFCTVEGFWSTDPDSLYYSYANHPRYIFDVFTCQNGWNAIMIDTLCTDVVLAEDGGFGVGTDAVGWDHDFQISTDETGTKIFFIWTDTDPLSGSVINESPDIKGFSYDINTWMGTPIKNFTTPDGIYYFINSSAKAKTEGNIYKIPTFYIDIWASGDPLVSQTHFFVNGIEWDDTEYNIYIDVQPCCNSSLSTSFGKFISQPYPNPFTGTTSIDITLASASSVEIVITNIMGQEVSRSQHTVSSGTSKVSMGSGLNSGIYFYTVTAGNLHSSGKIVVE